MIKPFPDVTELGRLASLRSHIFAGIRRSLELDGCFKSYEGKLTLHLPSYFADEGGGILYSPRDTYEIELACYVLGPSRGYSWSGKTLGAALDKAERDVARWVDDLDSDEGPLCCQCYGYDGFEYWADCANSKSFPPSAPLFPLRTQLADALADVKTNGDLMVAHYADAENLRAQLAAVTAERDDLASAIVRGHVYEKDHACRQCVPSGEIVVAGFVCPRHAAERIATVAKVTT